MNPHLGQLLSHHLVVEAGDLAAGLLPGVPGGDIQAFCDLAEQGQVQPGMALDHRRLILQEVAGKGGRADEVGSAPVADHMGQAGHPLRHQLPPHGKGHQTGVLLQHEQMDGGELPGRPLHQGQVAQSKGVGVHDDGGGGNVGAALGQPGAEAGEAVFPVLQKGEGIFHPGDLIEPQVLKEFGRAHFGVHKQVGTPLPGQPLHQMGDDLI